MGAAGLTAPHSHINAHARLQVNPGCMEATLKAPTASMKEHYPERKETSIDKAVHRKKVGGSVGA